MSISLTDEHLRLAKDGRPVHFRDLDTDFVIVRADLYQRVERIFDDDDAIDDGLRLMNEVMADDDANDPLLDSYQKYRS